MTSRGTLAAAAALACVASLAPAATMAAERGTPTDSRTSTIRGACAGQGRFALTARQTPDSGETVVSVSGMPDGYTDWSESDVVVDGDGTGGTGGGISGWTPTDGHYTTGSTYEAMSDPRVGATVRSRAAEVLCQARIWPNREFGRSTCSLRGRTLSVTAMKDGRKLHVEARFATVKAKSAWNASVSMTSADASEGAGGLVHASAAGVARFESSFGYAADRTVKVAFTDKSGHGCRVTLGTHALPPA
jgi:hypothetical protein